MRRVTIQPTSLFSINDFEIGSGLSWERLSDALSATRGDVGTEPLARWWAGKFAARQLELPIRARGLKTGKWTDTDGNAYRILTFVATAQNSEASAISVGDDWPFKVLPEDSGPLRMGRGIPLEMVNPDLARQISLSRSRLDEFENLKEDWDSYGAPPLDKAMVEIARRLLGESLRIGFLQQASGVEIYPIPTSSAGVALHYEYRDRELRFKLHPVEDDRLVYRVLKKDPENYEYYKSRFDLRDLLTHLRWLTESGT